MFAELRGVCYGFNIRFIQELKEIVTHERQKPNVRDGKKFRTPQYSSPPYVDEDIERVRLPHISPVNPWKNWGASSGLLTLRQCPFF